MGWEEMKINEWKDFTGLLERNKFHQKAPYLLSFRGQAKAEWDLTSSISRCIKGSDITTKQAYALEKMVITDFLKCYHLFPSNNTLDVSFGEMAQCITGKRRKGSIFILQKCWAIMQHYNCPTRLLDWTESEYAALYFAVDKESECDGAVWASPLMQYSELSDENHGDPADICEEDLCSEAMDHIGLVIEEKFTERSFYQQAHFTYSKNIMAKHNEVLENLQKDRKNLVKMIIPAGKKDEFLARLKKMNITASTLFPGLDGLGRAASESIKILLWKLAEDEKLTEQ